MFDYKVVLVNEIIWDFSLVNCFDKYIFIIYQKGDLFKINQIVYVNMLWKVEKFLDIIWFFCLDLGGLKYRFKIMKLKI